MDEWGDADHTRYEEGTSDDLEFCYLMLNKKEVCVVREKMGYLLSMKHCASYLHTNFPRKTFTHEDVLRCYKIFCITVRKANHVEWMNEYRTDVCFDDGCDIIKSGLFGCYRTKRSIQLFHMLKSQTLAFPCYGIGSGQEEEDWEGVLDWDIEKKRNAKYPIFTLNELLENDWAYEIFCKYWDSIPDHQDVRDTLTEVIMPIRLPKDIVDIIFQQMRCDITYGVFGLL